MSKPELIYVEQPAIDQLKENIESFSIRLSSEILEEIEKISNENPFPCP